MAKRRVKKIIFLLILVFTAFGNSESALAQEGDPKCRDGGPGPGCVPEIPASSAPFLLAGLVGSILWLRNFLTKK